MVIKVTVTYTQIPNTSGLVTKTQYDLDKQDLEKTIDVVQKKIPSARGLVARDLTTTQKLQILEARYLVLLD